MLWCGGAGKPLAVKNRVLGLPFLTSAILRTNFMFSLVCGSLHKFTSPANYKLGEWPAGQSWPPWTSSLFCTRGRIFTNLLVCCLPITLPFIHPSFEKSWFRILIMVKGILQSSVTSQPSSRASKMEWSYWELDFINMLLPHWVQNE